MILIAEANEITHFPSDHFGLNYIDVLFHLVLLDVYR